MICSTVRNRALTLHISLTLSAAADHADGLHSRLDHCMRSRSSDWITACVLNVCTSCKTVKEVGAMSLQFGPPICCFIQI